MPDFLCQEVLPQGADGASHTCVLSYDDRFFRRKVVQTSAGQSVLVDLPHATSLNDGDGLMTSDGEVIAVQAAPEPLFSVTGPNLPQLAWHIGNRHTPCQIFADRLLIQRDPVIRHMLEHVGAVLTEVDAPFTPEGGAYGHGRTHAHEHGHTAHDVHHHHDH